MTGWPLFAVIASVALGGAFVAYWSGVGKAERRAAWRLAKAEQEIARLRVRLLDLSVERQRDAANAADGVLLSAAEIDAWHVLLCGLDDDEAAA